MSDDNRGVFHRYITKNWSSVPWLHEDMFGELCLARVMSEKVNYFFICSKVYQKSLKVPSMISIDDKFINDQPLEDKYNICFDSRTEKNIDFEEKIEGITGTVRKVIDLFALGYTDKETSKALKMNRIELHNFKKEIIILLDLKGDFVDEVKPIAEKKSNYIVVVGRKKYKCDTATEVWSRFDDFKVTDVYSETGKSTRVWEGRF